MFGERVFYTFTDRYEGVSKAPFFSLNLALHVGDNTINVLENRAILAKECNFYIDNLIYMNQTHSDHIEIIRDCANNRIEDCDALITDVTNIPLMVMVADCIPILLYDPIKEVIAVVHAGREGTFKEIVKKTLLKMAVAFGCHSRDVLVCFGPSIGVCCYEIGEDLAKSFSQCFVQNRSGKFFLDLVSLNSYQLKEVGVLAQNIEFSDICTCCDKGYFSYRRDGMTGRFAGLMKLHG